MVNNCKFYTFTSMQKLINSRKKSAAIFLFLLFTLLVSFRYLYILLLLLHALFLTFTLIFAFICFGWRQIWKSFLHFFIDRCEGYLVLYHVDFDEFFTSVIKDLLNVISSFCTHLKVFAAILVQFFIDHLLSYFSCLCEILLISEENDNIFFIAIMRA